MTIKNLYQYKNEDGSTTVTQIAKNETDSSDEWEEVEEEKEAQLINEFQI